MQTTHLGLGSRLRQLSDQLLDDVDRTYEERDLPFRSRYFTVFSALDDGADGLNIADIAGRAGMSHGAVSQTLTRMKGEGLVATEPGDDARSRLVRLTPLGVELRARLAPVWTAIADAAESMIDEADPRFPVALGAIEEALSRRSFRQRIADRLQRDEKRDVRIVSFDVRYATDFDRLNRRWLEDWFSVEEKDEAQLRRPESVLESGGDIVFALDSSGRVVGTGALLHHGGGRYELAKMAVDPDVQRQGIGRRLAAELIRRYRARGGRALTLETSDRLQPAIALYRRLGFREKPGQAAYARSNVFMAYEDA